MKQIINNTNLVLSIIVQHNNDNFIKYLYINTFLSIQQFFCGACIK